ncbi:MAG: FecR domain-containing protein [Pirellulaceae bacterium]
MNTRPDKLDELISAWLDGRLSEAESSDLQEQLRDSPEARRLFLDYSQLDASLHQLADADVAPQPALTTGGRTLSRKSQQTAPSRIGYWLGGLATCALIAIAVTLMQRSTSEKAIASITGLSGPIRWTGDGGRVSNVLTVGQALSGGTIDGLSPESWFELQFNDGSRITLSGNSMLTVADDGQKILHLKSGKLSARVEKQPAQLPMLIYTRSAKLTILGTSFDVEAGLPATALQVSEGTVRVARTSDGKSIDVPAQHRVVAAADRDLKREVVPDYVNTWKSRIERGPSEDFGFGEWIAPQVKEPAMLRAVAFVPDEAPSVVVYLTGMGVTTPDESSVQFAGDSSFQVQGRMDLQTDLYLGVLAHHADGEFAGKFMTTCDIEHASGGSFTANAKLEDFVLDPAMKDYTAKLPDSPRNLIIYAVWCYTHSDQPSGMRVSEIALRSEQPESK